MLVLSRQRDETIMIGDHIQITVVDIRGDKVRLGITAPTEVPVHRKEVYEAIRRENLAAAGLNPADITKPATNRSINKEKRDTPHEQGGCPKEGRRDEGTKGRRDEGTKGW